jgi:hypothetical protein
LKEFFDLRTPQDHLKKLEREYAQLQADPGDVDTALSFFVTAAHLPELIKDRHYRKLLLNKELIIQICDELNNRGKHGKLGRNKPAVLHTGFDSFVERGFATDFFKVTLPVTLAPEAAQKLGMQSQATDVKALASLALEFWKAHPAFKGGEPTA